MTISEYIKNARKNMKGKPRKEQWQYFLEYYKWPALIALLVAAILVQGVVSFVTRKDEVLAGTLVNSFTSEERTDYLPGFYDYVGINTKKEKVQLYTDMALTDEVSMENINAFHLLHARIAAKDTDFLTADAIAFQKCAYSTSYLFTDLRTLLSAQELSQLEDRLYYIDGSILQQLQNPESMQEGTSVTYPPFNKPEDMVAPIPVGINISNAKNFMATYYPYNNTLYLGIASNALHPDMALQFIDYLLSENG